MDGDRELSDAWTGFTRINLLNERPPDGYTWTRRRLTRKQRDSRPDNAWPDMWKCMSDAAKRKAKQNWAVEKPKLNNARQLRGIFFIELEDADFKDIMKNARSKLEIPMPAAMPCKTPKKRWRNLLRCCEKQDKTCLYCRCRRVHENSMEGVPCRYHEDHIAAKGMNSLSHYNLVHKFILKK